MSNMELPEVFEEEPYDRYQPAVDYVGKEHRRSRWTAVLAIALAVLVVSLVALGLIAFSYLQGQQTYARLADSADLAAADAVQLDEQQVDWDALYAINPDTVAWLYIPGTKVNYPVVRGTDNEYYLTHDFTGSESWLANFGAIFMDWRNIADWQDEAYFMYGHHMNDGSMFADIARMEDPARFDASREVYVLSPQGNFKLRTFSLVHCSADDPLVQVDFADEQEMSDYIQDKIDRSVVPVGDIVAADEMTKVFAFSTCDDFSAGRYVLYAYVESEGDAGRIDERVAVQVIPRAADATLVGDRE